MTATQPDTSTLTMPEVAASAATSGTPAATLLDDGSPAAQATARLYDEQGVPWTRRVVDGIEALDHLALADLRAVVAALPADLHRIALPLTAASRAIPEALAEAQPAVAHPLFSGVAPLLASLHRALASHGLVLVPFINESVHEAATSAPEAARPVAPSSVEPASES